MKEAEVVEMLRLQKSMEQMKIDFKDLLSDLVFNYKNNPRYIDERKDSVVFVLKPNEIYLEIGNTVFIETPMRTENLTDKDFRRFYYMLFERLFRKL